MNQKITDRIRLVYFQRKPNPGNYSIENVFNEIRRFILPPFVFEIAESKYSSRGFLKRFLLSIESMFRQGDINHITGDIHFIALFLRKKKTILTIHDIGSYQKRNIIVRTLFKWFWIKLPIQASAIVTTVSDSTKKELLKYVKVDPSKIVVIHDPLPCRFVHTPKIFNKTNPRILQIGTKVNKNIPRLLKALVGIDCRLDLVGPIDDGLQNLLRNAGIDYANHVGLSDEEMVKLYQAVDLVVLVSTYEGFGMPIIEANAIGRVVVTSNLYSMTEVAGNAADLVNPYDIESIRLGIKKIIDDDGYREKLIANGLINVTRFEAKGIANQYCEIYKRVLNCA